MCICISYIQPCLFCSLTKLWVLGTVSLSAGKSSWGVRHFCLSLPMASALSLFGTPCRLMSSWCVVLCIPDSELEAFWLSLGSILSLFISTGFACRLSWVQILTLPILLAVWLCRPQFPKMVDTTYPIPHVLAVWWHSSCQVVGFVLPPLDPGHARR